MRVMSVTLESLSLQASKTPGSYNVNGTTEQECLHFSLDRQHQRLDQMCLRQDFMQISSDIHCIEYVGYHSYTTRCP